MPENRPTQERSGSSQQYALVAVAERLAEDLFLQNGSSGGAAPVQAMQQLGAAGLLRAPLPGYLGGAGLGTEPGGHLPLLRILAALGSADLALGRLYEGHVNALVLINAFGSPEQRNRAAKDVAAGHLFGVWNTGEPTPMRLEEHGGQLVLQGAKTFATGAAFVSRPIVTVEYQGWQMTLPHLDEPAIAKQLRLNRDAWQPLGMESSESFTLDFSGAALAAENLIGHPGDFYRDPLFRGGAIRFAAVQAGAVVRLARLFAEWVEQRGRGGDPYQIARLGELELLAQSAVLWIERAAAVAEIAMPPAQATEAATREMVRCGNMTRLAIERAATAAMSFIVPGVGAHGLLRPAKFERIVRDLTMYLRQPNPDGALADLGREALGCKGHLNWWSDSLPGSYA